jgi:parvulin-like peptidyl-prolyl isomerase
MTFRAKPAIKRSHRPAHDMDHRRTLMLNVGFSLVVVIALLILGGAAFASWYGDHLEALATVNDQNITKDDFRDGARIQTFRLDYREAQIRAQITAGKLTDAAAQNVLGTISSARQSIATDVMEQLIDARLETQLAAREGVTASDQDVDALLTKEATSPERRHIWIIGIKPAVTAPATDPTDQQKADAKAKADQALAELKAGKAWADVAKELTDDTHSSSGGDVGWAVKGGTGEAAAMDDALFALAPNGITDVQLSADGLYRIGRVTDIDPATVDQAFQQKIKDSGVSLDSYRRAVRADALKAALNNKLLANEVGQPSVQRHVAVIFLASGAGKGVGDEVQVRHILYSPNGDPQGAAALPATDPAWKAAQDKANATYADLLKDPTKFESIAKAESDDTGSKTAGGMLPYYTKADVDPAFGTAIFQDGLTKNQILAPIKSSFGWHIIQFLDRRKQAPDRMADIRGQAAAPGADFAALATTYSEDASKDKGGDIGWIAKNQLDSVREIAIFKAPVGGLSDPVTTASGIYLYKVIAEETRAADDKQVADLKANAYTNWYTAEKASARIVRLYTQNGSQTPAVQ